MGNTEQEDKYLKSLGETVVKLRSQLGFNQKEFAEAIGTTNSHLRRIERGEVNSSILVLRKIATELRVTIEDLVKE